MSDDQKVASCGLPLPWHRRALALLRPQRIEDALYSALSEKWCGNEMVPLDHRTLHFCSQHTGCEYAFSFLNDSFEVGIGYPDRWHGIYRRKDFERMIWWYLRQWAFSEWFGLRRWIWYKLLHRRCERWNNYRVRGRREVAE